MDHRRFLELFEEFSTFVTSLHTLYLDAVVGFDVLHKRLLEHQDQIRCSLEECEEACNEFQDSCSIDYRQLCGREHHVASVFPLMKQGEVKERTRPNGMNYIQMGRLCVVYAYAYWEGYLREEVRVAFGASDSGIDPTKHDLWGDMRRMRIAILHHNGVATAEFSKMKVLRWFHPDDEINLDYGKVKEMFAEMANFRKCLHALSLPP